MASKKKLDHLYHAAAKQNSGRLPDYLFLKKGLKDPPVDLETEDA